MSQFDLDCMLIDELGVAGFFEDLPVLMFVLGGTMCIVLASTWATSEIRSSQTQNELEGAAERIAHRFLADLRSASGFVYISSLRDLGPGDVPEEEAEGFGLALTVVMVYPVLEWLFTYSVSGWESAGSTGYARLPFNAVDASGGVVIAEVRVVVWQS